MKNSRRTSAHSNKKINKKLPNERSLPGFQRGENVVFAPTDSPLPATLDLSMQETGATREPQSLILNPDWKVQNQPELYLSLVASKKSKMAQVLRGLKENSDLTINQLIETMGYESSTHGSSYLTLALHVALLGNLSSRERELLSNVLSSLTPLSQSHNEIVSKIMGSFTAFATQNQKLKDHWDLRDINILHYKDGRFEQKVISRRDASIESISFFLFSHYLPATSDERHPPVNYTIQFLANKPFLHLRRLKKPDEAVSVSDFCSSLPYPPLRNFLLDNSFKVLTALGCSIEDITWNSLTLCYNVIQELAQASKDSRIVSMYPELYQLTRPIWYKRPISYRRYEESKDDNGCPVISLCSKAYTPELKFNSSIGHLNKNIFNTFVIYHRDTDTIPEVFKSTEEILEAARGNICGKGDFIGQLRRLNLIFESKLDSRQRIASAGITFAQHLEHMADHIRDYFYYFRGFRTDVGQQGFITDLLLLMMQREESGKRLLPSEWVQSLSFEHRVEPNVKSMYDNDPDLLRKHVEDRIIHLKEEPDGSVSYVKWVPKYSYTPTNMAANAGYPFPSLLKKDCYSTALQIIDEIYLLSIQITKSLADVKIAVSETHPYLKWIMLIAKNEVYKLTSPHQQDENAFLRENFIMKSVRTVYAPSLIASFCVNLLCSMSSHEINTPFDDFGPPTPDKFFNLRHDVNSLKGFSVTRGNADLLSRRIQNLEPFETSPQGTSFYIYSDNVYCSGFLKKDLEFGGVQYPRGTRVWLSLDGSKMESRLDSDVLMRIHETQLRQMGLYHDNDNSLRTALYNFIRTTGDHTITNGIGIMGEAQFHLPFNQSGSCNTFINNDIYSYALCCDYNDECESTTMFDIDLFFTCASKLGLKFELERVALLPPIGDPLIAKEFDRLDVDVLGYSFMRMDVPNVSVVPDDYIIIPQLDRPRLMKSLAFIKYPDNSREVNAYLDCIRSLNLLFSGAIFDDSVSGPLISVLMNDPEFVLKQVKPDEDTNELVVEMLDLTSEEHTGLREVMMKVRRLNDGKMKPILRTAEEVEAYNRDTVFPEIKAFIQHKTLNSMAYPENVIARVLPNVPQFDPTSITNDDQEFLKRDIKDTKFRNLPSSTQLGTLAKLCIAKIISLPESSLDCTFDFYPESTRLKFVSLGPKTMKIVHNIVSGLGLSFKNNTWVSKIVTAMKAALMIMPSKMQDFNIQFNNKRAVQLRKAEEMKQRSNTLREMKKLTRVHIKNTTNNPPVEGDANTRKQPSSEMVSTATLKAVNESAKVAETSKIGKLRGDKRDKAQKKAEIQRESRRTARAVDRALNNLSLKLNVVNVNKVWDYEEATMASVFTAKESSALATLITWQMPPSKSSPIRSVDDIRQLSTDEYLLARWALGFDPTPPLPEELFIYANSTDLAKSKIKGGILASSNDRFNDHIPALAIYGEEEILLYHNGQPTQVQTRIGTLTRSTLRMCLESEDMKTQLFRTVSTETEFANRNPDLPHGPLFRSCLLKTMLLALELARKMTLCLPINNHNSPETIEFAVSVENKQAFLLTPQTLWCLISIRKSNDEATEKFMEDVSRDSALGDLLKAQLSSNERAQTTIAHLPQQDKRKRVLKKKLAPI